MERHVCKLARLLSKLGSFEWTRPSTNDKQTSLRMRIMMREGEDDVCIGIGTILQLLNFRKFFLIYLWLLLLTEYGNLNLITATFNCYYQIIIIIIFCKFCYKIIEIVYLDIHSNGVKLSIISNISFFINFVTKYVQ